MSEISILFKKFYFLKHALMNVFVVSAIIPIVATAFSLLTVFTMRPPGRWSLINLSTVSCDFFKPTLSPLLQALSMSFLTNACVLKNVLSFWWLVTYSANAGAATPVPIRINDLAAAAECVRYSSKKERPTIEMALSFVKGWLKITKMKRFKIIRNTVKAKQKVAKPFSGPKRPIQTER